MRILLLNQAFYPDVASTAQHLAEAARALVARGHQVTVVTSQRAYDDPGRLFDATECWRGVQIRRARGTGFGKESKWGRALDCVTFLALAWVRLPWFRRQTLVVALSSPPLIGLIGLCLARLQGAGLVQWVMDLNPDEALAAGWMRRNSIWARLLERASRLALVSADRIIALDEPMANRIKAKGVAPEQITILPPWAHDSHFTANGRARFRRQHGLEKQFVVMYSGNHSPCHPLNTVLEAARQLLEYPQVTFLFVGGGSEFRKIEKELERRPDAFKNIRCLPYQPLEKLSDSLSAADLHLIVLGNEMVGLVHPCKIYNLLQVGLPILFVGPRASPTADLVAAAGGACFRHGQGADIAKHIRALTNNRISSPNLCSVGLAKRYSRDYLVKRLVLVLESVGGSCTTESVDEPPIHGQTSHRGEHFSHR